ncbi:NADPH cytochrome P450 [Penicillium subrubescens]|uniref:Self-sufficient cytochrome P450 monooxygenase CYP505E4 n=1 Tax=Penicillium subrubescens TaxID=1316194 RepID=A0A1Q5UGZ0_9EURO|nr:NADPH cytochrome P450 [Penicillium subrubescens]KAJ5880342.1 NADPH cytochrome P450 [Penicillium subrubescens]OKP11758.1 Bifunctional P-450:NADPH-P450 reductase [Penicillium subrubescens]
MSSSIPQPPRLPLLGNIFDVDPNDPWGSLKRLADRYGELLAFLALAITDYQSGPIYKIEVLGKNIVVIASASLAEEVCDEKRFRKYIKAPVVQEMRKSVHDALFTAYDDEPSWGIAHRIMAPFVAPSTDDVRVRELQNMAAELVAKWTSMESQRVNVTEDLKRLNVQSVMSYFFNQRHDILAGQGPDVVRLMDRATWETIKRPGKPKLLRWLYYDRLFYAYIKDFRTIAADFIADKEAERPPKDDMLHALLTAKDPKTGQVMDRERVIDEIITIMVTASSTTGLMSFALYYLLTHPEEMTKARQEIDHVLGPHSPITPQDLGRLPYLEATLRETLRLSAAAPGFLVEPVPSGLPGIISLAGGKYQIPSNQPIMVILSAVNRDPEVFQDPEVFRPERMLDEAYSRLPAGAKKGFGNGKRYCFGKRFAWQLSMITLISVLRGVDFKIADKDYKLKSTGKQICANFQAPVEFFVTAGPRNALRP